jgi:peptidoglycan hydrolase-like protein with peptidoglycan-binding domain
VDAGRVAIGALGVALTASVLLGLPAVRGLTLGVTEPAGTVIGEPLPAPGPPGPVTEPPPPRAVVDPSPPAVESDVEPAPVAMRDGVEGDAVRALQQRLLDLGYWLAGGADGRFGSTTTQAVLAFQKVQGLVPDGIAGPATLAAIGDAARPEARSGPGTGRVVEIDLARQVLLVVVDGRVEWAFNTSTGAPGWETPPGRFVVEREIDGIREAPLGSLYRPKYFHQGIAVHGAPHIPAHPASHGCARLHDRAMDLLWATGALAVGTPVWVY